MAVEDDLQEVVELEAGIAVSAGPGEEGEPDGCPGWRLTLYVAWVAQFLAIMGFAFVMPFIPFFIRELGVPERAVPVWAGWVITSSAVTMALAAPLWGAMADRYGRKAMVARAMLGGAVIMSLMGLVRNVYQLLGLRAAQGFITGTASASAALVASVVPKSALGYSLGLMQMAVFTGNSVGPLVGGVTADRFGYRLPFALTGLMLFTGGMLVVVGARERFVRRSPSAGAPQPKEGLLQVPGALILLGLFTLLQFSGSFVGPIMPLFVERLAGVGRAASATGIILAVGGVSSAGAALLMGRLSDRYGHRRILVACTAGAGLLCFPQAIAHSVTQLLVIRGLFGFAAGGMIPSLNALMATTVPRERIGRAYGLATTASAMGWGTGPAVGGWAASVLGLQMPFVIMGGLLLLVAVIARVSLRRM